MLLHVYLCYFIFIYVDEERQEFKKNEEYKYTYSIFCDMYLLLNV